MYRRFKDERRHKKMAAPPAPKVEYNYLGDSGLKVSNICLGTMTMGIFNDIAYFAEKPGQLNEKDSHALLDRFAELGGNFIDTADFYAAGGSERIVGTWLKKRERDRFVIATKCRFGWDPTDPNASGLSRKRIMSCVDNSLKRLQTDYIDLYQIHCWDYGVPIKETLLALNDLVRCGKVRYIGASNLSGWQLQKIVCLTEQLGLAPFISLQQQYNLLTRENEFEVFDVCENENIGILPWSPLKGGLLTGKYKRGQKAGGDTRLGWSEKTNIAPEYQAAMKSDKYWELVDAMNAIAKTAGKTVPQVALRWALQRPNVPSVLIGATKISQLEDNIGAAAGWSLTDEQMEKLNGLTEPTRPYPYNFIRAMNSQLLNAGKKPK